MCFDFHTKNNHPRICKRLIVEFIKTALTDKDKEVVVQFSKEGYGTYCYHDYDYYKFDIDYLDRDHVGVGAVEFRRDFISRYNPARGFADITLSLLHEIGHNEVLNLLPEDFDKYEELEKFYKIYEDDDEVTLNHAYFELTDEKLATDWAISWLMNKENRKIAKDFEKRFFEAWRGVK